MYGVRMTTDTTITNQTDVEVELHELLDWGSTYEYFENLLSDKIADAINGGLEVEGIDLDDPDSLTLIMPTDYEITSVPRPNVVMFSVTWEAR